jgi:hypothetical protein
MMQSTCRQLATLIALVALLTGPAAASSVVFEKVELFKGKTFFTETFQIDSAGSYEATLTDFEFPKPMKKMGLNVTTSKDTLGSLFAPGSFDFEADPGTYYVSFFALAGSGKNRDKDAQKKSRRDKEKHKDRHHDKKHHQGMSGKHKAAQQEKRDHSDDWAQGYGMQDDRSGDWGQGHGMMNLGQYGIQIAQLDDQPPAVPLPAAAWLFISGLLGMTGVGLRRKVRS